MRLVFALLAVTLCLLLPLSADHKNQVFSDFTIPMPLKAGDTLVIGIVGGWQPWDAKERIVRRIALRVRESNLPNTYVETVENHKLYLAEQLVQKALDLDQDGKIAGAERTAVKVILFGQSLGGRAVLRFSRTLDDWGIPVRRAIVIDAFGLGSREVPANVREVANLYQQFHPVLRGWSKLKIADRSRTQLLGNWKYTYCGKKIDTSEDILLHRVFLGGHTMMEFDPEVWARVQSLLEEAVTESPTQAR